MAEPRTRIAALPLGATTLLFLWWAWKQGAYFGPVFYPGAIAALALLLLLFFSVPFDGRLRGPAAVALGALLALTAWTGLSALWSDVPAAAVRYAIHDSLYVAAFALGLWVTNLLRGRMLLALAPLAVVGGVVGVGTVVVIATGTDMTWYLHGDATLRFPIGYRNANAAFLMICLWPCLALAAKPGWHWAPRAAAIATGTMLVELVLLAQSRGSMPAITASLVVFLLITPNRVRAAAMLGLILAPAVLAAPSLLEVYRHGDVGPTLVPTLHAAAKWVLLTSLLSFAVAVLALRRVEPRLRLSPQTTHRIGLVVASAVGLVVLVASSAFVFRHGGPIGFVDQRFAEFSRVGYPDLSAQGIRYGANVGSNRHDFWQVAADQGLANPLAGGGGGSFQVAYLEHRRSNESPEDPHSVEALMFSELGFPGLLFWLTFIAAAALAGVRARRLGPAAAGLSAGALAAATQWSVQSSFDWFWNYPGVTAPAIFLLGAASAPTVLDFTAGRARRARMAAIVALALLVLLAVPLFLSSRYLQRGYETVGEAPIEAIADFDRAAELNPLETDSLLAKGNAEARLGRQALALDAFNRALAREPTSYAAHYLIALALRVSDPRAAREAVEEAYRLNPKDPAVRSLRSRLGTE